MSHFGVIVGGSISISGALYPDDPYMLVACIVGENILERPKSVMKALKLSSRRTLSGFKSRCKMLFSWRYFNPRADLVLKKKKISQTNSKADFDSLMRGQTIHFFFKTATRFEFGNQTEIVINNTKVQQWDNIGVVQFSPDLKIVKNEK